MLGVERKRQGSTVTFGSRWSKQSYILAYTPDSKRENLTMYNFAMDVIVMTHKQGKERVMTNRCETTSPWTS